MKHKKMSRKGDGEDDDDSDNEHNNSTNDSSAHSAHSTSPTDQSEALLHHYTQDPDNEEIDVVSDADWIGPSGHVTFENWLNDDFKGATWPLTVWPSLHCSIVLLKVIWLKCAFNLLLLTWLLSDYDYVLLIFMYINTHFSLIIMLLPLYYRMLYTGTFYTHAHRV